LNAQTWADIHSLLAWPSIQKRWAGTGDTLAILERIGKEAEPPAIAYLMSFALAPNRKVRAKSRSVIRRIFDRMPIDLLPLLDESLRRGWSQLHYWYGLNPREARKFRPRSQDDWLFLALLSSHRDGFVRAAAVQTLELAPPQIAIPFLIIRIVDWVREVRLAAEAGLLRQMKSAQGKVFVDCLGLLDRLSSSSRYRVGFTTLVESFLKGPEQAEALSFGLLSANHSVRRRCFVLALENPELAKKPVIERALNSPDVVVRKWAFQEGPLHCPGDWINWAERAATDPYGPIRRIAFDAFAATTPKSPGEFHRFLLDRSTEIRLACQSLYTLLLAASPAGFYRKAVEGASPKNLEVAIRGISETSGEEDRSFVIGLLASRSALVRRASIQALGRFGTVGEEKVLLQIVASDTRSVARDAAAVLLHSRGVSAFTVWSSATTNPNKFVPLAVIRLFKSASKWQQIKIYLEAVMSLDRDLSECAVGMIFSWVQKFNRSFAQPSGTEMEAASTLLETARSRLPASARKELDFLFKATAR
jgi:HEAT repeat protein